MEYEIVLLRPDELYLKSEPVMRRMMKQLVHNVKVALKDNDIVFDSIIKQRLGIVIKTPEVEDVINLCRNIPGISTIFPAVIVGKNIDAIKKVALELAGKPRSFAIRVKRSEKEGLTSKEIEKEVGAYVQEKTKSEVNLTKPSTTIFIEMLEDKALLSTIKYKGIGGLPVGVSGKVICLAKDDKDLIAAWLFLRRGCEVIFLHFRESDSKYQKFLNRLKVLSKFSYGSRIKCESIKGTFNLNEAEKFAIKKDIKSLCLGSKTPKLLKSKLLIFEPLIGLSTAQIAKYKKVIFK